MSYKIYNNCISKSRSKKLFNFVLKSCIFYCPKLFPKIENYKETWLDKKFIEKMTIFRKIVLPHTLIKMFPSLSSQFIFIFLTTGIISEIGVNDLTHAGLYIDSRTFRTFEIFIILSILYVALSLLFKTSLEVIYNKTLKKRM